MEKHFTVTGFVVHEGKTLLLWHPVMQGWAPPGGHIEPNEDPQEAVLREIREETGLDVCPMPSTESLGLDYPQELAAPVAVQLENSFEPGTRHQHVDLIYFCVLPGPAPDLPVDDSRLTWVNETQLQRNDPLPGPDGAATVAEDIRLLGLRAIVMSRKSGRTAHRGG